MLSSKKREGPLNFQKKGHREKVNFFSRSKLPQFKSALGAAPLRQKEDSSGKKMKQLRGQIIHHFEGFSAGGLEFERVTQSKRKEERTGGGFPLGF